MQDRVSLYPGRVKLEPVEGQANTYDLTRADQPTQEGTPLNKASLLKDTTAALYGLGSDAVPDDAFSLLSRFHKGLGNEYLWEKSKSDEISYVNSPDPNAYPPAVSDGYTYTSLGKLGSKVRFETGSYVGNGTSGYNNQNSLEFGMYANLVFIFADNSGNDSRDFALFIRGASYGIIVNATGLTGEITASVWLYNIPTFTETGVSWYSNGSYDTQLNTNGTTYNYLAI